MAVRPTVTRLLAITGLLSAQLWGQEPTSSPSRPTFEVASIKPNVSGDVQSSLTVQPGGRVMAINIQPRTLISFAYQVQEYQIVSGPSWLDDGHFDIQARPEGNLPATPTIPGGPPTTAQLMVRSLLEDRFALRVHQELRDIAVYRLTTVRADGRVGPGLRPSSTPCVPTTAPVPTGQRRCGFQLSPGSIDAVGRSMEHLAGTLTQFVRRPVFNQTSLDGAFDFDLEFAPEVLTGPGSLSDRPPLSTVLAELLGLRLANGVQAAPVVVVDAIQRPTPD